MGRIRGKRNRDQDRYWTIQKRAEQSGMVGARDADSCAQCGAVLAPSDSYRGWCLECVTAWASAIDPFVLSQIQSQLPLVTVDRSAVRRVEELQVKIIHEAPSDKEFLPLLRFMGGVGIGHMRAMWNFLQSLYLFEVPTTGAAANIGRVCPNMVHLCGRHAPVQRMSLQGFLSRVDSTDGEFALWNQDKRFVEFIRGFISDNRLWTWRLKRTSVDVLDRYQWERHFKTLGFKPHFDKHSPAHWPFEGEHDGQLREKGTLEELPDVVMQIGSLVPKRMPESLREDLCQDLVVAVLSGETTVENLRDGMAWYIRQAFKNHPLKYGRYSLDGHGWKNDNSNSQQWAVMDWSPDLNSANLTDDDMSPARASRGWLEELCIDPGARHDGWHEGHDRLIGLASVGEQLRNKNDGHAIVGPSNEVDVTNMDPEIQEVYEAELHPQWRRRLTD